MKETLESIIEKIPLNGSKAYLGGLALILLGVASFTGFADASQPMVLISQGLGLIGIRHALSKSGLEAILAVAPQVIAIIQEIRKRQVAPETPVEAPDVVETE